MYVIAKVRKVSVNEEAVNLEYKESANYWNKNTIKSLCEQSQHFVNRDVYSFVMLNIKYYDVNKNFVKRIFKVFKKNDK